MGGGVRGGTDFGAPRARLHIQGGGIFKSTDGGETFVRSDHGIGPYPPSVLDLAEGPSRPLDLYAATHSGVLRSADGGETWEPSGLQGDPLITLSVLTVPGCAGTVYAGLYRGAGGGVWVSYDAGDTWAPVEGLEGLSVFELTTNPGTGVVFAATERGVYRLVR